VDTSVANGAPATSPTVDTAAADSSADAGEERAAREATPADTGSEATPADTGSTAAADTTATESAATITAAATGSAPVAADAETGPGGFNQVTVTTEDSTDRDGASGAKPASESRLADHDAEPAPAQAAEVEQSTVPAADLRVDSDPAGVTTPALGR
jgi:hypothetical protein